MINFERIVIPKENLRSLYLNQKLSTYQIAKMYRCYPTVIQDRLKEYRIRTRHPKQKIFIKREALEKLYLTKKLSIYKIAKIYNCASSAIYYKLKEYKIKTRPLKKVYIDKKTLEYLYLQQRQSISQIAKTYNCSSSVILSKIQKYNIKSRNLSEAMTKYAKKDFLGNAQEKAYIIGFRLGDLNVRQRSDSLISIKTGTTKIEQVELIREVFSNYGHFYVKSVKDIFYVECSLNKSFSFLIPKNDKIENWIMNSNHNFFAFLAGYTDAEGNIGVYDNRARYRVGTYDKNILKQIYSKLNKLEIRTTLNLESKKGTNNQNQDFWRINVNCKDALLKLFELLGPFLKHSKRINDMNEAKENIIMRNERFNSSVIA